MGKKKTSEDKKQEIKARAFVLKVAMHCSCDGCIDKIRAAAKDITRLQGIETWDQSALESKGELVLVATADPDKLRQRLHKATRKQVDLILPAFPSKQQEPKQNKDKAANAAALLLNNSVQQQGGQYGGHHNAAWANQLLAGTGCWNAHGGGEYPWAAVQQQQQADPYYAAYPPAPLHGHGGAYYYGGAWHGGHGY